jgi:phosphate starvation-inducible PhoH-like protein
MVRLGIFNKYTPNQKHYKSCLYNKKPLLVVEGPAGCGKTMIACLAAKELWTSNDNKLERLILTRPLVTVNNESIGYLPGTIDEKMQPWVETFSSYLDDTKLKSNSLFVPLGFIRGATWDNSLVIADEMQNSTKQQMLTLLTRIGYNTKLVVIGDCTQSDLSTSSNGLLDLKEKLANRKLSIDAYYQFDEFVDVVQLGEDDIKRSPFVQFMTKLYS